VLLAILGFFCLAFTASAFLGYSGHRVPMPDVPDRYASIAEHLSSALQAPSYRMLVNENYDGALHVVAMCVHSVVVAPLFFSLFRFICPDSRVNFGNLIGTRNQIAYAMDVTKSMCGILSSGHFLFCTCQAVPSQFTHWP
jgi:hypothetical protein